MNEAAARAIPVTEAELEHVLDLTIGTPELDERFLSYAAQDALDNEQSYLLLGAREIAALRRLASYGDPIALELVAALDGEAADELDVSAEDAEKIAASGPATKPEDRPIYASIRDYAGSIDSADLETWAANLVADLCGSSISDDERLAFESSVAAIRDVLEERAEIAREAAERLALERVRSLQSRAYAWTARVEDGKTVIDDRDRARVLRYSKRHDLELRTRTLETGAVEVYQEQGA